MKFRILGPVEVVADGRTLRCTGRPLSLLVLLLLERGGVVPADAAIEALWRERLPAHPESALNVVASRLRRVVGEDRMQWQSGGYRLASSASDALDADEFAALARRGRETLAGGDAGAAREVLDAALALWRGRALEDVRHEPFALAAADGLDDARLDVLEARIDADLALGRHHHLLTELAALVARHPLRERLRGQLMLALYRCGRQAEALTAYRDLREALGEELGLEPSEELRALQRAILLHEAGLPAARATRREVVCVVTEVRAAAHGARSTSRCSTGCWPNPAPPPRTSRAPTATPSSISAAARSPPCSAAPRRTRTTPCAPSGRRVHCCAGSTCSARRSQASRGSSSWRVRPSPRARS